MCIFLFSKRNTGFRTCRQNLLIVFCGLSKGNAKVEMIIAQKRLTNLNAIFILLNVSPRSFYFILFFSAANIPFFPALPFYVSFYGEGALTLQRIKIRTLLSFLLHKGARELFFFLYNGPRLGESWRSLFTVGAACQQES